METMNPDNTAQFSFPKLLKREGDGSEPFYNDLLRGLTHKLNNLYAVVQGFSSLIMMNDEDLDPSLAENIRHMKDAAQNASALTEKILTAGGCAKVDVQTIRLDDYLGMVGEGLKRQVGDVPLRWEIFEDIPNIMADPTRFKEILTELLKNAGEAAAAAGGDVSFEVIPSRQNTGNRVEFLISNTGGDFTPDQLKDMFRPFHSTKSGDHSGIGLTTAAMLAAQMKMPLGVRSKGGTVTFWLSCAAA